MLLSAEQDWFLTVLVVATHLVVSLSQLVILGMILVHDTQESQLYVREQKSRSQNVSIDISDNKSSINDTNQRFSMTTSPLDTYRDKEARKKWFEEYLYLMIVILYHIGFDLYRLWDPHTFVRPEIDGQTDLLTTKLVIFYLISYAMRMAEEFPSLPTLTDMVFGYLELKTHWFDALSVGRGKQSIRYGLCFALRVLTPLFMISVNASTYIFADYDYCTDYFVCIYSWEHFFFVPVILGWVWGYYENHFDGTRVKHWMIEIFLLTMAVIVAMIPFLLFKIIIPFTLLISLLYETINATIALYLLSMHQTKNG